MSVISDIALLLRSSSKKVSLGSVFAFVLAAVYGASLFVTSISIHNMSKSIVESNENLAELIGYAAKKASTDSSFEIIMYELRDSHTHKQIIAKMNWWKKHEWGAQIGESKNQCKVYPQRLDPKMTVKTRTMFCRIALSM